MTLPGMDTLNQGNVRGVKIWTLHQHHLISWGIALFEYALQVPANRIGFKGYGGPFSLIQLKVIQEVITLVVFVIFSAIVF